MRLDERCGKERLFYERAYAYSYVGAYSPYLVYGHAPNYVKDFIYLVSDLHMVPTRSNTNEDGLE